MNYYEMRIDNLIKEKQELIDIIEKLKKENDDKEDIIKENEKIKIAFAKEKLHLLDEIAMLNKPIIYDRDKAIKESDLYIELETAFNICMTDLNQQIKRCDILLEENNNLSLEIEKLKKCTEFTKKCYESDFKSQNELIKNLKNTCSDTFRAYAKLLDDYEDAKQQIVDRNNITDKILLENKELIKNFCTCPSEIVPMKCSTLYIQTNSKESLEYKLLEEKYNLTKAKIDKLNDTINNYRSHQKYLEDKLYAMNSKKSGYLNKALYLEEQIHLLFNASSYQRLKRQNSKGITYEEIKLKPDD